MVASASKSQSAMPPARPKDLASIQYLRGFAATAVVIFHACQRAQTDFVVGAAGVDLFFVISGFIMWVVSDARPISPQQFALRRLERIVPLYWAVTLGTAAVAVVAPVIFPNLQPTLTHVLASIFFVPHYDASGQIYPLIVPGWSLNYEMFFYVVFTLGLAVSAKRRLPFLIAALVAFVLAGRLIHSDNAAWQTYTSPLLLEFLTGVLLGVAYTRGARLATPVSLLLIAGGVAAFTVIQVLSLHTETWRVLQWGLPALAIVSGAVFVERTGKVPYLRLPHFIGDASYSIYLVHGFAVSAVFRLLGAGRLPVAAEIAVCTVAGLAAGAVAYLLVERPLLKLAKYRGGRRAPAARAAALAPAP
jgi:exopolysaccharide production protein ExoZ